MYESAIGRRHPGCILLLLDQSSSMLEPFAGDPETSKAVAAARIANEIITEVIIRCRRSVDVVYPYFDLGAIAYGGEGGVGFAWRGPLGGHGLISAPKVADNLLGIEERALKLSDAGECDEAGVIEQKFQFPVWFEPVAGSDAPIAQALAFAGETAWDWVTSNPDSFPPVVFLISGGEADPVSFDGADPFEWAQRLRGLETRDGPLLLCSVFLSGATARSAFLPSSPGEPPDGAGRALFEMSSVLPAMFRQEMARFGPELKPGARGFALNHGISRLVQCLPVGTRVTMRD
jgi:hypothetical protein